MAGKKYNFESWKCNVEVLPPEIGESFSILVPIHEVLTSKKWCEELITGGYIEQQQIQEIRQKQKNIFDKYLKRRWESAQSDIKSNFDKADRQLEFLEDALNLIYNRISLFREKYPEISMQVYQGADISYMVDPDLFKLFDSAMSRDTKLHPITYYSEPDELMPMELNGYLEQIFQARQTLEKYCQFWILTEQEKYLEKLKYEEERRRKDKRGRSDKNIIVGEDFFQEAKRLRREMKDLSLSQQDPNNPSDELIGQLIEKGFIGYEASDPDKKFPKELKIYITIKRKLQKNREKWLV